MSRWISIFIVLCGLLDASTHSVAEDIDIPSLPARIRESIVLDLRVRESTDNDKRRLALIATFAVNQGSPRLFNPFGFHGVGRPYQIVITNLDHQILATVVPDSAAMTVSQHPDNWIWMRQGMIVGQCFWSESLNAEDYVWPFSQAELPKLPAGRYHLRMLASRRSHHTAPPQSIHNLDVQQGWFKGWNDERLDEMAYTSPPAVVEVDANGEYHPILPEGADASDANFETVESEYRVDSDNNLTVATWFVNPQNALLVVKGHSIYQPRDSIGRVEIVREDGMPFDRFPGPRSFSGDFTRRLTDSIIVPQNCVIGGIDTLAGKLPPGRYLATTTINESIYADKLYPDGKRSGPADGKWPVAFKSRTKTITVLPAR